MTIKYIIICAGVIALAFMILVLAFSYHPTASTSDDHIAVAQPEVTQPQISYNEGERVTKSCFMHKVGEDPAIWYCLPQATPTEKFFTCLLTNRINGVTNPDLACPK